MLFPHTTRIAIWILPACCGLFGQSQIAGPPAWRGWDTYQVIMWSVGAPQNPGTWQSRLRELGFTGEQCSAPAGCRSLVNAGLGFYVENLVSELGFHHARGDLYKRDWAAYTASEDKAHLVRQPCLDDPSFWERVAPGIAARARAHAPDKPLAYDLRDEPSLGSFVSPMDYCFCRFTLQAFRNWLKQQYGSLEALNREWETAFAVWEEVVPSTTFEIKRKEKSALIAGRPENYASWADHRAFMDYSFAAALSRMRAMVHEQDPRAPVGIAGVQMPSAWGGYDLWRLSQAVDWMEPYDIANSRAILGSFLAPGAPVLATYFGSEIQALRRTAWSRLLDGDRGAIIWDDEKEPAIQKTTAAMPVLRRGADIRDLFREIRPAAATLAGMRRLDDRIAIHYSQSSIRAHWMFDSREDGNTWFRRLSSYEPEHSRLVKVRNGFVKIVEDLGLTAGFVSYEQIEKDELLRAGYKVLLLPQSVAMSAMECRRIEAFVREGGVVIADNMVATMDEHGRRLPAGQLDWLFGVKQNPGWKAEGGDSSWWRLFGSQAIAAFDPALAIHGTARRGLIAEAPAIVENRVGKGRAFYLNLGMHGYAAARDGTAAAGYRRAFESLFRSAGVTAQVKAAAMPQVKIHRFAGNGFEYVAIMRNTAGRAPVPLQPLRVHVVLANPAHVRQEARDYGVVRELDIDLDPSRPAFLELRAAR